MSLEMITHRARAAVGYLPKGGSLPEEVWRSRHRTLLYLLRAHVIGVLLFALLRGYGLVHAVTEAGIIGVFACVATTDGRRRRFSSAMVALGLVTSSAVLVHLSGGTIEMHFHFFVMVGILSLYQDWLPFLLAIAYVVAHHGVIGTTFPDDVYNHAAAVDNPIQWALIHGVFVLAASMASVVAWKRNEEQALRDPLTRLPNRALFHDRVGHALTRTRRSKATLAVLFVDLDGFKTINDTLGHDVGDTLIVGVGERLRAAIRPGDTVARLGGDEFGVLVEDIRGPDDATGVAERVLAALVEPFVLRDVETPVRASVGVALGGPGLGVEELLRNADVAMYSAKNGGRGRYSFFEDGMRTAVVERAELERDLRRAIDRNEFVIHYQPQISLGTGSVTGVEALVRWNHPSRGLLPPASFLPVAEQSGLILPIGAWVLNEACRQARTWNENRDESLSMSVNISAHQLLQSNLADTVRDALVSSGLDPRQLVLEVTESAALGDTPAEHLYALKALGVQLAIDDFGTGYSSLSYLRRLPFDVLKIDKLFVDGIAAEGTSAIGRAIIRIAESLQLETVAEGVEDAAQASELAGLGCKVAQGFHFAVPLPAEDVEALLGGSRDTGGMTVGFVAS